MSLTEQVKDELVRVCPARTEARYAEAAAMLRFSATMEIVAGRVHVNAELDYLPAARRLQSFLQDNFEASTTLTSIGPGGKTREARHRLRISRGSEDIIRRLGLVTRVGTAVVGLPPHVVSGGVTDAEAAWRGAFLAAGTLNEPRRTSSLEIVCPGPQAAMAMVGCARRLGIVAKTKESRGVDRVVVRDGEGIGALLSRMGAHVVRVRWDDERRQREQCTAENRLANFDDANLRRSARAAIAAAARVERAMDILGDEVPEHLAEAGQLRLRYRQASLEELGRLAEPQMTKDAIAGRIRRLLSAADKRARELGIADTTATAVDGLIETDSVEM